MKFRMKKTKVPYEVIASDNNSARVKINDRVYSPPENQRNDFTKDEKNC